MRKRIMIGALVSLVAGLGLWLAAGSASATHTTHMARAQRLTTVHASIAETSTASGTQDGAESGETESQDEPASGGESEGAADAAAQAAACEKAGITGSNVQFDDQTGQCSLDTGGNDGGGEG